MDAETFWVTVLRIIMGGNIALAAGLVFSLLTIVLTAVAAVIGENIKQDLNLGDKTFQVGCLLSALGSVAVFVWSMNANALELIGSTLLSAGVLAIFVNCCLLPIVLLFILGLANQ